MAMMHTCASNSPERQTIPLFIAAVAFGLAWLVSGILGRFAIEPPFWIDVPSTAALYGLGYRLFKHRLWKLKALSLLGWVRTPVIEGDWTGFVRTSFDQQAHRHHVEVSIKQNWTELSVRLKSEHSSSHSVIAAITVDDAHDRLSYEYVNEPHPGAVDTMHTHRGTTRLEISPDRDRLEGEYYSGRDRTNQGLLSLERKA
jgi:hypothetical protein